MALIVLDLASLILQLKTPCLSAEDSPVPVFDTTAIHARIAVEAALEDEVQA